MPQEEAKQQYTYLSSSLKTSLPEKISKELRDIHQLSDFTFTTYIRQIDNKIQMNAADVVYALSAILECSHEVVHNFESDSKPKANQTAAEIHFTEQEAKVQKKFEIQVKNFWTALDCMNFKNSTLLLHGVDLAKKTQQAIFN